MRRGDRRCEQCQIPLTAYQQKRFCSLPCAWESRRLPRMACEQCGKPRRVRAQERYCSWACMTAARRRGWTERPCLECRQSFTPTRKQRQWLCSDACTAAYQTMGHEALAVMRDDPARWWSYADLAQAVYGFADEAERHALRVLFSRLRQRGVIFERRGPDKLFHSAQFRLADEREERAS